MKKFDLVREYVADRLSAMQYPEPIWMQRRRDSAGGKLPWTTRVHLALFGFLILGFAFAVTALASVFFYAAFT